MPGITELTEAVARYYFKLLAIKDEYEVARLYAETRLQGARGRAVRRRLHAEVPPGAAACSTSPIRRRACRRSREYGPWMLKAFGVLAKLRKYRGTALDIFGQHRRAQDGARADRRIRSGGRRRSSPSSTRPTTRTAVDLAEVPEHIRGYGHVKEAHVKTAKTREAALLAAFRAPSAPIKPAVVRVVV